MRRFFDYFREMRSTRLLDREIEALLSGSGHASQDWAPVASALDLWRSDAMQLRHGADQIVSTATSTALLETPRSGRPAGRTRRRFTLSLATSALAVGLAGTAFASNAAGPGDLLYPLDRTLEHIGIGNGGGGERIAEADDLLANGDFEEGIAHLATSIDQAFDSGDLATADKVQRHLDLALNKANPQAQASQEKVAALQEFIEANKGSGVGLDGSEFGRAVSEMARGIATDANSNSPEDIAGNPSVPSDDDTASSPGNGNAGPKDDHGNQPDNAGPKDKQPKEQSNQGQGEGNQNKGKED